MSQQLVNKNPKAASGTTITLSELIALRAQALQQAKFGLKRKLTLPGHKLTKIHGRGIEFDATREYQAGDDIRSMAWRVTARSLKPHIKVYREEKERPVWLAVDLSPSLYFGTRCMFKSVQSITQAALAGWTGLLNHERVGAVICAGEKPLVLQPHSSEKYYLAILNSLAESSLLQPAFNAQHHLHQLLISLQQIRSGSLIHIYSDFSDFDSETEKLILYLSQRAQLILNFIYDPFEAVPPPPQQYMLTNGQQKMRFDMQDTHNREIYRQLFLLKVQQLKNFSRKLQIPLRLHCTDSTHEEAV